MRLRLATSFNGGALEWHQRAAASPRLWWDAGLSQLTLQIGHPSTDWTLEIDLGPAEAAELYRRLRECYPPAQIRRRRR